MPVKEAEQSLSQFLETLATEMKGIMDARNMNASGRSRGLIEARVDGNKGELFAPAWILFLERGRGPTKSGSSRGPTLRSVIRKWIDDKGIVAEGISRDSLAFLITRKIHEEGTLLHRRGGSTGIISTVITRQRIDAFLSTFGDERLRELGEEVDVLFKELFK